MKRFAVIAFQAAPQAIAAAPAPNHMGMGASTYLALTQDGPLGLPTLPAGAMPYPDVWWAGTWASRCTLTWF